MKTRTLSRRGFGARLLQVTAVAASALATGLPQTTLAQPAASVQKHARPVNAVVHWNGVADQALTPTQGTNPMAHSRILAILHASIHDALNAIDRRYQPYTPGLAAARHASPDAAVAAASREVLVRLLPEKAALVEAAYGRALADLRDGLAKTAGIGVGQAAAWATLARRQNDRAAEAAVPYVPAAPRANTSSLRRSISPPCPAGAASSPSSSICPSTSWRGRCRWRAPPTRATSST